LKINNVLNILEIKDSVKKLLNIDFLLCAIFAYWANIELFDSRPRVINYMAYLLTAVVLFFNLSHISKEHISIYLLFALFAFISLILPSGPYFTPYLRTFVLAGSMGFFLASLIKKPIYIVFWQLVISLPVGIKTFFQFEENMGDGGQYMSTAYLLFNSFCCLLLIYAFKKKNLFILLGVIVLAAIIIFTGTRGAIVGIFLSILICVIFAICKNTKRMTIFFAFILILLLIVPKIDFVGLLNSLSEYFGFNSRLLSLLNSDKLFVSNSRINIYSSVIDSFINGGLFGYGFGAVQYISHGEAYSHNFLIELLADFGIISIIILYGFYRLIKLSLWKARNFDYLISGLLCVFIVVLPKLFSGTILYSYTLPMIGLLLQIKKMNKIERLTSTNNIS